MTVSLNWVSLSYANTCSRVNWENIKFRIKLAKLFFPDVNKRQSSYIDDMHKSIFKTAKQCVLKLHIISNDFRMHYYVLPFKNNAKLLIQIRLYRLREFKVLSILSLINTTFQTLCQKSVAYSHCFLFNSKRKVCIQRWFYLFYASLYHCKC